MVDNTIILFKDFQLLLKCIIWGSSGVTHIPSASPSAAHTPSQSPHWPLQWGSPVIELFPKRPKCLTPGFCFLGKTFLYVMWAFEESFKFIEDRLASERLSLLILALPYCFSDFIDEFYEAFYWWYYWLYFVFGTTTAISTPLGYKSQD